MGPPEALNHLPLPKMQNHHQTSCKIAFKVKLPDKGSAEDSVRCGQANNAPWTDDFDVSALIREEMN